MEIGQKFKHRKLPELGVGTVIGRDETAEFYEIQWEHDTAFSLYKPWRMSLYFICEFLLPVDQYG